MAADAGVGATEQPRCIAAVHPTQPRPFPRRHHTSCPVQPPSPRRRCASTSRFNSLVACAWRAIPDGFRRGPCSPTSGLPASSSSQTAGSRSPLLEMLLPDTPSFHPCLPAERMGVSSLQTGHCVLYFSISRSISSGFSPQCLQ